MAVAVKICGLSSRDAVEEAVRGNADYIGFIFYPPSPRYVTPLMAAALAALVPTRIKTVAVFVDPSDETIAEVLRAHDFAMLQLHGQETPDRVAEIKRRFKKPVIKAVPIALPQDLDSAATYDAVADVLLFDAKPPKSLPNALPGGNGLKFDWTLLATRWRGSKPWILSGGLDAAVLAEAVAISGTLAVDVSSGVEDKPGVKSLPKIRDFLKAARATKASFKGQP